MNKLETRKLTKYFKNLIKQGEFKTKSIKQIRKLPVIEKINVHKLNWTNHVKRMLHNRLLKIFLKMYAKRQKKSRKTHKQTDRELKMRPELGQNWSISTEAT